MHDVNNPIHIEVKEHYAAAAKIAESGAASCCGPDNKQWGTVHYDDLTDLPDAATLANLGCGNPPRLPTFTRARPSSTSALVVGSTYCCRPGESGPPATSTAWT